MRPLCDPLILIPVAFTSLLGVIALAPRRSHACLGVAILRTLESLGFATGFFALNLVTGALLVLVARRLGEANHSLYAVSDAALLGLSLLQGLLFAAWCALPAAEGPTPSFPHLPSGSEE